MRDAVLPSTLSPDEIVRRFRDVDGLDFIARPYNMPSYRPVRFHPPHADFGLAFKWLLVGLGIKPEVVRPIFETWGLLGVPDLIHTAEADVYDELGGFRLEHEPFQALAKLLDKRICVYREYGDHDPPEYRFTVAVDGTITGEQPR